MKIGVVIPCINLWDKYTKNALASIKSSHSYRIVVIDNASTDRTLQGMEEFVRNEKRDGMEINYIRNPERKGCAQSWNQGVNDCFSAGCDYVMVINNDVLLNPNCIDRLVQAFEQKYLMQGDNKFDLSDAVLLSAVHVGNGNVEKPEDVLTYDNMKKEMEGITEHPDFSGFMVSRECWDKIGEFDEGFNPIYFEDNDYHKRINLAGKKAFNIPTATYFHFLSKTQTEAIPGALVCDPPHFAANREYFIKKWGGIPDSPQAIYTHPFNDSTKSIKWTKQKPL